MMAEKKIPIILDTDPGHDDAFAIMMALASPKIELLGLTSVAGNSVIENTTRNCLRILEKVGRTEVPVAKGIGKPLSKPLIYDLAKKYHGESGLEGPSYPEVKTPLQKEDAVDFIARVLKESEEKVTLVPVGPLTNIAAFILSYPELLGKIEQISIMGGLTYAHPNGASPAAEFNIFQDPEAADIVFKTGIPIIMHSINSTSLGQVKDSEIEHMRPLGRAGEFAAELLEFYRKMFRSLGLSYYNICDSHAVAWLIDPTIYGGSYAHVEMDLDGEYTRAMTVSDLREDRSADTNCFVIESCDQERYFALMFQCLKDLG